jgi:hypothetical protein
MNYAYGVHGTPRKQAPNSQANQKTVPRPHTNRNLRCPMVTVEIYIKARGPRCKFLTIILVVTALQVGRSQVRFPMVSLEFFIDIILLAALWPWG